MNKHNLTNHNSEFPKSNWENTKKMPLNTKVVQSPKPESDVKSTFLLNMFYE